MIHRFDACEGWNTGFQSCAHWLSWRTGIDLGAACEKVWVARALEQLPAMSAALQRGCAGAITASSTRDGWTVALQPDGTVQFTRPDGRRLDLAPAAPALPVDAAPLAPTMSRLAAGGIVIDARTMPVWQGERFDAGWVLDALRGNEPIH